MVWMLPSTVVTEAKGVGDHDGVLMTTTGAKGVVAGGFILEEVVGVVEVVGVLGGVGTWEGVIWSPCQLLSIQGLFKASRIMESSMATY